MRCVRLGKATQQATSPGMCTRFGAHRRPMAGRNAHAGHVRRLTTRVTHVLPVSDDGGSTAEIVRVLGGPAVGDIRSRCLRLADDSDDEVRTQAHAEHPSNKQLLHGSSEHASSSTLGSRQIPCTRLLQPRKGTELAE